MTATIEGWLPQQLANGSHGHWTAKRKKLQEAQEMAYWHARQAEWAPIGSRAHLEIVLVFPDHRRRDTDNLYARCKGVVDGLKPFLMDDSTEWLDLHVRAEVQKGRKATMMRLEAAAVQDETAANAIAAVLNATTDTEGTKEGEAK